MSKDMSSIMPAPCDLIESQPPFAKRYGLTKRNKYGFSIGHVLNDLCASMWFSYLLAFFHLVLDMPSVMAGFLLMTGQIADGVSTVFVGLECDRGCVSRFFEKYGKRKSWHLVGTICVACTYTFVFMDVPGPENTHASNPVKLFYYAMFIIIFQFGWASSQISHLSLIPNLTECTTERTELNAYRYAFTILSNLFVYLTTWFVLQKRTDSDCGNNLCPHDVNKFMYIVLSAVCVGILFSLLFHLLVVEKPSAEKGCLVNDSQMQGYQSVLENHKNWKDWFKELTFYKIALVYMFTRLAVNVSQTYTALYLQVSLKLPKESVGYIPLLVYGSGLVSSFGIKYLTLKAGKKVTFTIGCFFGIASSALILFCHLSWMRTYAIYPVAAFLGIGTSTMLVTALALVNDMIGSDVKSSAFVFGSMSFVDKFSNGAAIMIIQVLHPPKHHPHQHEGFYHSVLGYVCGTFFICAFLSLITLHNVKFHANVLTGANRNTAVKDSITSTTKQDFIDNVDQKA